MKWKFRYNGLARGIHTIEESDGTPIAHVVCDVDSRRTARLMAAAPEMLALLALLAAGYECPPVMSGDNVNVYDSRDELLRETDHYSCLVDEATQLLAKIEREDA